MKICRKGGWRERESGRSSTAEKNLEGVGTVGTVFPCRVRRAVGRFRGKRWTFRDEFRLYIGTTHSYPPPSVSFGTLMSAERDEGDYNPSEVLKGGLWVPKETGPRLGKGREGVGDRGSSRRSESMES